MRDGLIQGLKPLLIKRLALLMGICYLINPLHEEINIIAHAISHTLTTPSYVMTHNSNQYHETASHGHQDYHMDYVNQNHLLADIIDYVFEVLDDSNEPDDTLLTKTKIDKHIRTYAFHTIKSFEPNVEQKCWVSEEKLESGYLRFLKKPPQFLNWTSA